jgi:tripartite-type tricarboxylate transporter receptor subunit TctC
MMRHGARGDRAAPASPADADRRRVLALGAGAGFVAFGAWPSAIAQAFADHPVRIVPFGTGGGPIDALARIYGEKLKARWGQPIVVEPRPGASGIIAADFVAKAPPDGHTVLMTLSLTHVNNAILQPKLPYDPFRDFEPLSELATGGPMLIARANAPYANVAEFVAWAKTQQHVTYGTWGNGSTAHLFGELLKRQNGLDLVHVPYRSEAAAHTDMLGGSLALAWANPSTARALAQAGRIKVLGITGSRRVRTMPEVATFAEQGCTGFDLDSWIGVYAPAKTPPAIVGEWVQALREITRMPDVQERLAQYGFEPLGNTPKEFVANVKADYPRVAELIRAAGVTAE